MFPAIIKVLFSPTANVLYHRICWKTCLLLKRQHFLLMTDKNYNHQISWPTWANVIFGNHREHHAFLFIESCPSIFSTLCLVLCRLLTLVLAGVKHNPYAKTEVPLQKKCNSLFMCNLCANPRTFPKHRQTHSAMAEFIFLSTCPELVNGVWHEESRAGERDWMESDAECYSECSWWRSLIVSVHEFAGRSITQVVTFISPDFYQKPFYENVRMPHHIAAFTSSPFSLPLSPSWKLETSYSAEKTLNVSIVQQILEYRKLIFCSYFKGKVPQSPRRWSRHMC